MYKQFLLSLMIFLSLFAQTAIAQQQSMQEIADSAFTNFNNQNYERAVHWFNLLTKVEQKAAVYYYKGYAEYLTRRHASALKSINKALELDAEVQDFYLLKAYIYQQLSDTKNSVRTLRKGFVLDEKNMSYSSNLAYGEFIHGNYSNALRLYKAIEKHKGFSEYITEFNQQKLAETYFILRSPKKAHKIMDLLIAKHSEELSEARTVEEKVKLHTKLIDNYTTIGAYEKAKEHILQGLSIDPDNSTLHSHLGYYYIRTHQADSSVQIFRKIDKEDMNEADKINLLYSLSFAGESEEAIEIADELLRIYPNYSNIYGNRALAYLRAKNYEMAEKDFMKTLELKPNNPWVFRWLGTLYYEQGDKEKACKYFNKANEQGYGPVHFMEDPEVFVKKYCK